MNARVEGLVSCVLDAEVVAYDREKKCILPFQVLSTRKRKVEDGDEENTKVCVLFCLLFTFVFHALPIYCYRLHDYQKIEGYFAY